MKRSDFLKKLGIGLGVAIVAPQVLAGMPDKVETLKPVEYKPKKLSTNITVSDEFIGDFSSGFDGAYSRAALEAEYGLSKHIQDLLFLGI